MLAPPGGRRSLPPTVVGDNGLTTSRCARLLLAALAERSLGRRACSPASGPRARKRSLGSRRAPLSRVAPLTVGYAALRLAALASGGRVLGPPPHERVACARARLRSLRSLRRRAPPLARCSATLALYERAWKDRRLGADMSSQNTRERSGQ